MRKILFPLLLFLFVFYQISFSYTYREGDWTSYTMTRYVSSIAMDDHTVYFGTSGGVIRCNKIDKQWAKPFTTSNGLPDNRVNRIAFDPDNDQLWIDTPLGIASYNPTFKEWRSGATFPYELVKSDKDSLQLPNFLMEFGYNFNPEGYILDQRLSRYNVIDYLRDDWGDNVWLATWGLGVAFGFLRSWNLELHPFGLYQNDVKDVCIDGQIIWFGGNDVFQYPEGITRYDRAKEKWEHFIEGYENALRDASVNSIKAGKDFVWFGTSRGMASYSKKEDSWRFYTRSKGLSSNQIICLEYYQNLDSKKGDVLFIGTSMGICFYRTSRDSIAQIEDDNVNSEYINCLKVAQNYLWIGTKLGIYRISLTDSARGIFSTPDGITLSNVNDIETDRKKIWFATDKGILGYDSNTGEREAYQLSGSYPGSRPLKLAVDDKNVWVGTENGVWKMNRQNKVWVNFTIFDGLIDNDIQAITLDGDYIWFGTPQGATLFYWNNPFLLK